MALKRRSETAKLVLTWFYFKTDFDMVLFKVSTIRFFLKNGQTDFDIVLSKVLISFWGKTL